MRKLSGFATMLALGIALAPAAFAGDASTQAAAEALFREGRALMQQGKYPEACQKLKESQRLDPGAGTLLNLAACYEKGGQTASAWATYSEAAASAARSGRKDWEATARERAHQLEPTLSSLTIDVPPGSDVPGLKVERDGVEVARPQWGVPIPVDPGLHPVAATAPRKQQWSTTVTVGGNAAKATVTIPPLRLEQAEESGSVPTATPVAPMPTPEPSTANVDSGADAGNSQRTWGLVLGGVGVAGVAAGSIFGLMAKSKHDDALEQCDSNNNCTAEALELDDTARSRATVSTILLGVGAASLIGGTVLYLSAPSSSVSVGAAPTPNGAAFSMQGVW